MFFGKSEGFSFHFERKRSFLYAKRSVVTVFPAQELVESKRQLFSTLGPRNQWAIQAYSHWTARFTVGFYDQKARTGNT